MKTTSRLIVLVFLAGIFLTGCSSNSTKQMAQELAVLESELQQTKTSLAEQKQINEVFNKHKKLTKDYVDLYNQPLEIGDPSSGGLTYLANAPVNLDGSYSIDEPLTRVEQLRGFLQSFADLTEKSRKYMSKAELEKIGNTGWEIQTLGFHNIPLRIEGSLREQNYIIKWIDLGLAINRFELGEIEMVVLQAKAEAFKAAQVEYLNFARNSNLAD